VADLSIDCWKRHTQQIGSAFAKDCSLMWGKSWLRQVCSLDGGLLLSLASGDTLLRCKLGNGLMFNVKEF